MGTKIRHDGSFSLTLPQSSVDTQSGPTSPATFNTADPQAPYVLRMIADESHKLPPGTTLSPVHLGPIPIEHPRVLADLLESEADLMIAQRSTPCPDEEARLKKGLLDTIARTLTFVAALRAHCAVTADQQDTGTLSEDQSAWADSWLAEAYPAGWLTFLTTIPAPHFNGPGDASARSACAAYHMLTIGMRLTHDEIESELAPRVDYLTGRLGKLRRACLEAIGDATQARGA